MEAENEVSGFATPDAWPRKEKVMKINLHTTLPLFVFLLSATLVNAGLVAYYPMDGDTLDASGNALHGTSVGAGFAPGHSGMAADLDGIADYIILPPTVVGGHPAGSFSAWVYVRSFARDNAIIASQGGTDCSHFFLDVPSTQLLIAHVCGGVGGTPYVTGNNMVPTNTWTMVTFTWDGAYWRFYLNGLLDIASPTITYPPANTDTFKLGRHEHSSGPFFFDGLMDDVRIYDHALSAEEVAALARPKTPCELIEDLMLTIESSSLQKNKQPLLVSLAAACESFQRGNTNAAINQLQAFQNKVRAQVAKQSPTLAEEWTQAAQKLIDQ